MNDDTPRIRRLVGWNRFWLMLVALQMLIGVYNYAEHRVITQTTRLEVRWTTNEKGEPSLVFSSAGGGPFMLTQLASDVGEIHTATANIANLSRPLFIRGPKSRTYFSSRQLDQLVWLDAEGKKVSPPKPDTPLMAIYYELHKTTTTD